MGSVEQKLDTGDYTILGLEEQICIERKASTTEMAVNFGRDKSRFMDEIERMKQYTHKFLVLEFSFQDLDFFPQGSSIPAKMLPFVRVTGSYMIRELTELQARHDIHVVYAGNRQSGHNYVNALLRRFADLYSE